jgi:hypothetical protein
VVQLGDAGLGAPPADHLADAVHGHGLPVLGPQPQRRFGGPLVPPPHPQVAVEGRGRLGTERHGPRTAALPHHGGQPVVEVDVSDRAVSELGQAQASVGEQPQDRLVAPVDEALAGAGGDQGPQPVGREHRHGPLGHHRRAHLLHRVGPPASSPSFASQPKSCCSDRNRTDAVDGERDSIRCVMKSATWSRVTSSTSWSGCKLW